MWWKMLDDSGKISRPLFAVALILDYDPRISDCLLD
jgi:hypothetical protein